MSLGQALLDRRLPLHAHISDDPRWYRRAEAWATTVYLGLVDWKAPAVLIIPDEPRPSGRTIADARAAVSLHLRFMVERLEIEVSGLENRIAKLIDCGLEQQSTPDEIEQSVTTLLENSDADAAHIIWANGYAPIISERVSRWRWNNSPRGRRAMGQ